MRQTLARLQAVQSSVKELNDAHKILLQRSPARGRAAEYLSHFAMTYADPAAPRAPSEKWSNHGKPVRRT